MSSSRCRLRSRAHTGREGVCVGCSGCPVRERTARAPDSHIAGRARYSVNRHATRKHRPLPSAPYVRCPRRRTDTARQPRQPQKKGRSWFRRRQTSVRDDTAGRAKPRSDQRSYRSLAIGQVTVSESATLDSRLIQDEVVPQLISQDGRWWWDGKQWRTRLVEGPLDLFWFTSTPDWFTRVLVMGL